MKPLSFFAAGAVSGALALLVAQADASFHEMQIEEVIAGINGDTSAQAIQLRMRVAGQNFLKTGVPNAPAVLRAWDAKGANPVILITFDSDVTNGAAGDTVLITSTNFALDVSPAFTGGLRTAGNRDFTFTNLIPASYLAAGKLTYEESTGTILWSVAWGGAGYTGATGGTSGLNGALDPGKFGGALPSTGVRELLYGGLASGSNSNDATDYSIVSASVSVENNARAMFTVVPEPSSAGLVAFCGLGFLAARRPRIHSARA